MSVSHPLDNPIWHSLNEGHQEMAIGDQQARRYPSLISPLAAIKSGVISNDAALTPYDSLASIMPVGESVFLFLDAAPETSQERWQIKFTAPILQMVCQAFVPPPAPDKGLAPKVELLSDDDVADMLALTKLTEPGPFLPQTNHMGKYYGIIQQSDGQENRLAAMGGVRLHLDDYTEVSAICTHPDFQGRGFAKLILARVCQNILDEGKTPFLHVKADNWSAIRTYEKLGFAARRHVHFAILEHAASPIISR